MKIVDVNILLLATNSSAPLHAPVLEWWQKALDAEEPIGLPWHVIVSFVRISTQAKAYPQPLSLEQALEKVTAWLAHSNIHIVQENAQHYQIFADLLLNVGQGGNLTTDAHLAALAVAHDATIVSCDSDFSRFLRVRWENPLAE